MGSSGEFRGRSVRQRGSGDGEVHVAAGREKRASIAECGGIRVLTPRRGAAVNRAAIADQPRAHPVLDLDTPAHVGLAGTRRGHGGQRRTLLAQSSAE
jgi:hypothetical protein